MQRRNFIQAGLAAIAGLFSGRSVQAKPKSFVDPRRGSEIKWPENHRSCEWVDFSERVPPKPGVYLLNYKENGSVVSTSAYYIPYRAVLAEDFVSDECEDFYDHEEETDTYWAPEGFYEYQSQVEFWQFLGMDGYNYKTRENEDRMFWWMEIPKPPTKLKAEIA